jgi:hypothetical protein
MPKILTKHNSRPVLGITTERETALKNWIYDEIEDALKFRKVLESSWSSCLKMYNGVPKILERNIPIEGAPNIEVTIGAIAVDTIYAQAIDLIFNTSPLITARAKGQSNQSKERIEAIKALQNFINHIASSPESGLRDAADASILDDTQLGTGFIYTPWVEKQKKTKTAKVLSVGPKFYAMPVEDVIVPAGSYSNIQDLPLLGLRFYKTEYEINALAKSNRWKIEGIQPLDVKSNIRIVREQLGKNSEPGNRYNKFYEIYHIYCQFDIDGDGIDEDLLVIWNHSGRVACHIGFNPLDRSPLNKMVYQLQSHIFYGLGVLQMLAPYEEKVTDVHNYATLNILLANSRMWVGSESLPETMKIWPGKYVQVANPAADLQSLQMADVYNSIWQDQAATMQLANQRVGINEVSQGSNIPSRTPGITAMSFIQQVNKRFVPAFDSMRACVSGAVSQALYRYQERLLAGDVNAEANILAVLGYKDGTAVINLLRDESFDEQVTVELTAASASVNREADKQNSMMLVNILSQYYQKTLELSILAANPQTPPEVRSVALKIVNAASEIIDRTIRTFDQVRDPSTFVIELENEINSLDVSAQEQQGLAQLIGVMGGGGGVPEQLPIPGLEG